MIRAHLSLLTCALLAGIGGCGGDEALPEAPQASEVVIGEALVAKMWPVLLSDDAARASFESDPGWQHLFERSYGEALSAFKASNNGPGLARVHQEYAAVYRQGALVAANATGHVYANDKTETDPTGLQYMVGVSRAIQGDLEAAGLALKTSLATEAVHGSAQAWTQRLAGSEGFPTQLPWLDQLAGPMGPVVPGTQPTALDLPHYRLAERSAQGAIVGANDPTALLALSAWHLEAARLADSSFGADLPLLMNTWRLPVDSPVTGALTGDAGPRLFGRVLLCPEDVYFLAAVDAGGPDVVAAWADRSPLAAAIAPAWDGDKLDHQMVLDQSVRVMRQAQATMVAASGGKAGFHRPFALFVRLGVLRAGMRVADKAGQYRDAGILRLEALERMEGGKGSVQRDPAYALSVAAWDASNRSPLRPEDILHKLIADFPALAAARSPLEALHLRLNRHAAPSTPVH
jgi:hypothetical protein